MFLDKKLLINLLYGAALLGSGGGGRIDAGMVFIENILSKRKKIKLLTHPISEKDKKRSACIVCDIGSISAFDPQQTLALDIAFNGIQEAFKEKFRKISALFPIETGPENILAPFVIAASYEGMCVVDGDGAGRAVPTLPLSTFSSAGPVCWKPVAIASGKGDLMMVGSDRIENFDALLRKVAHIDNFSDSASLALWPDRVGVLAENCIKGSVSRAVYCGMLLEGIIAKNQKLIDQALMTVNELNGYLIRKGKLLFKESVERGGFSFNTTKFIAENDEVITVISQNENLMVFSNESDGPIAIAPDSICYLRDDMKPFTNSEIAATKQLTEEIFYIVGVEANVKLHEPDIIKGFDDIVQELRYNTKSNIKKPVSKPLGNLLIELSLATEESN